MAMIKGKWQWKETISNDVDSLIVENITFTSNGEEWRRIQISTLFERVLIMYFPPEGNYKIATTDAGTDLAVLPEYRLIDFGMVEQEVSNAFYEYFIANARAITIAEKLTQIAENEPKVYEAGKKSEYDAFWDTFQKSGTRIYYDRAFADGTNGGNMWVFNKTYRPKYPMKPVSAASMYSYGTLPYEAIASVDFSECTNFSSTFSYFRISGSEKKFPPIDIRSATKTQNMFGWCSGIREIEEIKISENTEVQSMFNGMTSLCEVRFNGTIGQNGLNVQTNTLLSHDSLMSIINALADKSQDTSGTSWVVTLGSTNLAKLTDAEKQIATDKGWTLV